MNTLDVTERNTLEKILDIKEKKILENIRTYFFLTKENFINYKGMLGRTLWKNEISQT